MVSKIVNIFSLIALISLTVSCAQERPLKPVLSNNRRILKKDLDGTFLFHKTVTGVKFAGGTTSEELPTGRSVISDVLTQFRISENKLEIVSIDPLFQQDRAALQNTVLATFPIRNVDILRKQNADGEDTNEEEETETRRPWNERDYIIVSTGEDSLDSLAAKTKTLSLSGIAIEQGAMNFSVTRQLEDEAEVTQRYSFLKYAASTTYEQREYPFDLQTKFGFFKTQTVKFDKYGRITKSDQKEFMNRWDTSKKIVYYLSSNYPKHLIAPTRHVFEKWNEAFKAATGKDTLEVRENSGQELGDLRYSMITFDETEDANHGILGYGPSYTNPRTGEIVKGDVILYGGVLRNVVFRERIWEALLNDKPISAPTPPTQEQVRLQALKALNKSRFEGVPLDFSLFKKISTLAPPQALNKDLLASLREELSLDKMVKAIRTEIHSREAAYSTQVNESVFQSIKENIGTISDEELERIIFIPLLTHELGHNFGLRHNFMGSADHDHFGRSSKTSSIMDYGFLSSQEGTEPGPYDRAAIVVGYSDANQPLRSLLEENFFYCTDEDTFSSQTALCNQFDAGHTLSEVSVNQIARYRAGYTFNNTQLDRVFFNQSDKEYVGRIIRTLLPIRFQYDNAATLLKAIERKDLNEIWLLARQRVEADKHSNPASIESISVLVGYKVAGQGKDLKQIPITVERRIDTDKIDLLRVDAELAKKLTLQSLRSIVLNDDKSDYGTFDSIGGEMLVRGVLLDKIYTLKILGAKLPSPLYDGTVITTYPEAGEEPVVPTLFRQVLSNMVLPGEPGSKTDPNADPLTFDINLREEALNIIRDQLSDPSLALGMRKLIATERIIPDKNNEDQKKLAALESKMRGLLKKLYKGGLTEEQKVSLNKEINDVDLERNRDIPFAQTEIVGDLVLKAPIYIEGFDLISASGLFIRNTVNVYEQIAIAMREARDEVIAELQKELAKPEKDQNKQVIEKLEKDATEKNRTVLLVNQILETQRSFADKMQKAFDPR